jgi:hypothetical protein
MKFQRVYILQSFVQSAPGSSISYQAGHYYNVSEELAQQLIDAKHAELDEVREARLLLEELRAKQQDNPDESGTAADAAAEHATQPPTAE